jgi:1-acyl-sn-glycerol-3-phosphate acyltransferase
MYDIIGIIWYLRRFHTKFVSKKELGKGIPSVSFNLRHGGSVLIDRKDPKQAIPAIKGLSEYIEKHKRSAVIFPEGTRANAEKRSLALIKIRDRSPERYERLQKLKYLLPPKPAGLSALLAAVPQATVVTMWHSGFDGMDTFRGIVRQLAKSAVHVHVKVVEHQRSTVASGEAFIAWLDTQWAAMDESVSRHLADSAVVQHNGGIHG